MAHSPGLGLMFTGFDASTLKAHEPIPRRGINELKFIVNSGADSSFTVPTAGSIDGAYGFYNWNISWGDGTIESKKGSNGEVNSGISHSYPDANTEYEIKITPVDPVEKGWLIAFSFNGTSGSGAQTNRDKILRITSGELTEQAIRVNETDNGVCTGMFSSCTSLTSIGDFNLPQDLSGEVGNNFCTSLFSGCTKLTSIGDFNLPQGIINTGTYLCSSMCSACTSLTSLGNFQIPQGIIAAKRNFCHETFKSCTSLVSIGEFQIPQGIVEVENSFCSGTFRECTSLASIGELQLPPNITILSSSFCTRTFNGCTSLISMGNFRLPQGIVEVFMDFCSSMCANCSKLETIPTSFFGDLQLSQTELNKLRVLGSTFTNCSVATGDMAGVPMLQISPTASNKCFQSTRNVLNVPANWK